LNLSSWLEFYQSDLQSVWALLGFPLAFLIYRAARAPRHETSVAPGCARFVDRYSLLFAVLTLLATQAMNLAFIVPLKHAGLALAVGLGACLNAGLLFRMLRRHGIYRPQPGWAAFFGRVAASVCLMALALHFAMGETRWWLSAPGLHKVPALAGLVLLGAAVYGGSLLALGIRVRDFARQGVD